MFDIELLYIKLYMIYEVIEDNNLPLLDIKNLKLFRLAFAHDRTQIIFQKVIPSVQYVKWFKKDMSEICFNFIEWDKGSKDIIMEISKDINTFQNWYNLIFDLA